MADPARTHRRVSRSRRARPARVGPMVTDVLERIGIRERVERSATASRWEDVVGPHIARVSRAGGIKGGTLFVEVDGAPWMTELNMMRRTLLRRLNEDRDCGQIERIVFVQSDKGSAGPPLRARNLRGRG